MPDPMCNLDLDGQPQSRALRSRAEPKSSNVSLPSPKTSYHFISSTCTMLSLVASLISRRIFPSIPMLYITSSSGSSATHHLTHHLGKYLYRVSSCDKRRVTINILPDDVLLHVFQFFRRVYFEEDVNKLRLSWRWNRLVHVCRRWRYVVFGSPNFLDLKLVCNPSTRMELTAIWPPLPIVLKGWLTSEDPDFDTAIARSNRVYEINLHLAGLREQQQLTSAMQWQFPALIHLRLSSPCSIRPLPVPPDGFLGGSAPRLQSLELVSFPFPALPKFLLSATGLVRLNLERISDSGYISPEEIVTCLAVMANLKSLIIKFESPFSHPNQENRRSPLPTCTFVPALTHLEFQGGFGYSEDLVSRIDAPSLDNIWISLSHQHIFDISQLAQFVRRTTGFKELNEAHVDIAFGRAQIRSFPPTRTSDEKSGLNIILINRSDRPLSPAAQVFTLSSLHTVEHLYIYGPQSWRSQWEGSFGSMHWLEKFHQFTALKNLYVCMRFARSVAGALQELARERTTDVTVLPALESLFLERLQPSGPIQECMGKFVAARQLSGRPIAVNVWERDSQW